MKINEPLQFIFETLPLFGEQVSDNQIDFSWTVEEECYRKGISEIPKLVAISDHSRPGNQRDVIAEEKAESSSSGLSSSSGSNSSSSDSESEAGKKKKKTSSKAKENGKDKEPKKNDDVNKALMEKLKRMKELLK